MSDNPYAPQGGAYTLNMDSNLGNTAKAAASIKDVTTASFAKDVMEESRNQPVLVDFWAPWCGPCKQLGPIIEKAVNDSQGAVQLVKMNIDDHPTIAGQLGIKSIPAVVAFVDGRPVDAFMGAVPESEVKTFIAKLTSGDKKAALEEALTAADELMTAGDIVQAAELYSHILQAAPDSVKAMAGLAACLLESSEVDQAKAVLKNVPEDKKTDAAVMRVEAKIALAEQIKTLGDPVALQKRIQANPKDYAARFDLALIHNAQDKRAEAADELLAIMQADRAWNDDGARKQLLQFFDAWGPKDDVTLSARRKLSSLLFS